MNSNKNTFSDFDKITHNDLSKSVDISYINRTNNLKNSYNTHRMNQLKVTSDILGLSSRKEIYQKVIFFIKKPVPIDTTNKFWGIDSKQLQNDIIVQKQSFDQSYRNFWSYIDFNAKLEEDKATLNASIELKN